MPIEHAPYDREGNLLHYVYQPDQADWRANEPFRATLTLQGAQRGRSSTVLLWSDQDGKQYPMFVKDVVELLRLRGVRRGAYTTGRWHVVKRGQNYGVAVAPSLRSGQPQAD